MQLRFLFAAAVLVSCGRDGQEAGECNNSCSAQQLTLCSGNKVQICTPDAHGCLSFAAPVSCGDGQFCDPSLQRCAFCQQPCKVGAVTCAFPSGTQTCAPDARGCLTWGPVQDCASRQLCDQTVFGQARCADYRRVFVTSGVFSGNLGGLAGADAKCQAAAAAATAAGFSNFAGTVWKAWLSDSSANAIDRLGFDGPYYAPFQNRVFNNKAHVAYIPAHLYQGINVDETGRQIFSFPSCVWTGTLAGGTKATNTCQNWTDASCTGHNDGETGGVGATDNTWTELGTNSLCGPTAHLICFEQ
jgi:hypothetical protein